MQPSCNSFRPFWYAFSTCPSYVQSLSTNLKYASLTSARRGISYRIVSSHNPSVSMRKSPRSSSEPVSLIALKESLSCVEGLRWNVERK
jgi:hypothetical protein